MDLSVGDIILANAARRRIRILSLSEQKKGGQDCPEGSATCGFNQPA